MTTYSFTRLSTFERCPRRFEKIYIEEEHASQSPAAAFGELLHTCVAEYLGKGADAQAVFQELFSKTTVQLSREHFEDGLDILKNFVESTERSEDDTQREILALEQQFDISINGVQLTGRIDRIDRAGRDTVEVIDYKSNFAIPTRGEVSSDVQLSIYCIAAGELYPDLPQEEIKASIYLLRHGFKIETKRSQESLDATKKYITSLVQRIESTDAFEPALNSYCLPCDFRFDCPAFIKAMTETPRPVTEDLFDLKSVAAEFETIKATEKILSERKKELQDVLYVCAENQGYVEAAGMRYALRKVLDGAHSTYDLDALWDYLTSIGIDPKGVVSVMHGSISRLLKELKASLTKDEYREVESKIGSLRQKVYRTQLKAAKARH